MYYYIVVIVIILCKWQLARSYSSRSSKQYPLTNFERGWDEFRCRKTYYYALNTVYTSYAILCSRCLVLLSRVHKTHIITYNNIIRYSAAFIFFFFLSKRQCIGTYNIPTYVSIISTCVIIILTIVGEYIIIYNIPTRVVGLAGGVTYLHGGGQRMQMRFISIATCCVQLYCSYCAIAGRLILRTAINTQTLVGTTTAV